MRIVAIHETTVPLNSNLKNSAFDFSEMTTSVVAVETDVIRDNRPVVGFSFNSTGRYSCGATMRQRMIPRLLSADPETLLDTTGANLSPEACLKCMMQREKPGGHTERSIAVGTIELAIWDAVAKIEEQPLYVTLAKRFNAGRIPKDVACYVGGGWYAPGKGIPQLLDEVRARLDEGYTTMKIKVGGAELSEDMARVEAVLQLVGGGEYLAVDANATFNRDRALEYASRMADYKLLWFEEPADPLDFALLEELAGRYDNPLATGENLFSTQDVANLLRYGGLRPDRDILQMDIPQSYGIVQFIKTLEVIERLGWQRSAIYPHGGNLMTLSIVAGLGLGGCEAYPEVFGPFSGFYDTSKIESGRLKPSDLPGIGFEGQTKLYQVMRALDASFICVPPGPF